MISAAADNCRIFIGLNFMASTSLIVVAIGTTILRPSSIGLQGQSRVVAQLHLPSVRVYERKFRPRSAGDIVVRDVGCSGTMGDQSARIGLGWLARIGAPVAIALLVANCAA